MKIFIGMISSHAGPMEQNTLVYAKALNALGHQVHCLIYKDCAYKQELKKLGATLHFLTERSRYNPLNAMHILRLLKKNKADIILLHGNRIMSLVFNPFARWFYQWNGKKIGIAHNFQCRYLNKLDALITTNGSYLNRLYRIIKTPIFTLQPTIITQPVTTKLHHPLTIGLWDNHRENIITFLNTLNDLKNKKVDFRAVIATQYTSTQFKELTAKIKDTVKFMSQTSEKNFYNAIDLVCCLTQQDIFGLSVLKAMAYKKALVCLKSAGTEALLKDISCLPLPYLNPSLLSGELQNLLTHPKSTQQQAQTAYTIFNHKYCFKMFQSNLNRILKTIIQGE